jgi:hypothetical protein
MIAKLTQDYQEDSTRPGVLRAKFGNIAVTLTPRHGAVAVYRDGVQVGEWPEQGYSVTVHGVATGIAWSLASAKALGEHIARHYSGAYASRTPYRHAMDPAAAAADVGASIADSAAMMARFPFTPSEVESLRASRHHADILDPPTPDVIARRVRQLTGG